MHEFRLGDEIDDFCIKCKRLTNHAIVSLLNGQAAKVRCRTCYHDHDFRNGEPLPSKKDLLKQKLLDEALAGAPVAVVAGETPLLVGEAQAAAVVIDAAAPIIAPVPAKKGRKAAKT